MKHRTGVIGVLEALLAVFLASPALAELSIDGYSLVSKSRVSRVVFEYTYHADLTNSGPDVENVAAMLSSSVPTTVVVDADLNFGTVGAGSTVTSTDTFTIRQDRRFPFSWSNLDWNISFDPPTPVGVLLQGDPADPAINATVSLFSPGADSEDILDYVILNRLSVMIDQDATVGEVNQALLDVNGRITDMDPGSAFLEVAIPRQVTTNAVGQIADQLATSPAILFAFPARVPKPALLPPDHADPVMVPFAPLLDSMQHLLPTRFPAAWNAAGLIEFDEFGDCVHPVTVLVADYWYRNDIHPESPLYNNAASNNAGSDQLSLNQLIRPDPSQPDPPLPPFINQYWIGFHGYDVMSTLGAAFDADPPTGAMPLNECLNLVGVPVNGYSWPRAMRELRRRFPASGKFLINASLGFGGDDGDGSFTTPLNRAVWATQWRVLVEDEDVKDRFLLFSAAGNDADDVPFVNVYPGAAMAGYSNPFSVAAIPGDPLFNFTLDVAAWGGDGVFPDVTASPADLAALRTALINNDLAEELDNVLTVGSTENHELADDVVESDFSDARAQVYAVGENIPNLILTRELRGTSFAAPQVAGLAAYLWLIAPELTDERIPAFVTRYLIEHSVNELGTSSRGSDINLIDAYLAALTFDLDPDLIGVPPVIQFGVAPVREAILGIDGDGLFDVDDLKRFLWAYYDGNFRDPTVLPVLPSLRNYSRFDLNGNGFTGGSSVERFDLDLLASPELTPVYDENVLLPITLPGSILDMERSFDENSLTDLQILCYYAYSPLYFGDIVGTGGLDSLTWLSDCLDVETVIDPPANIGFAGTVQLGARVLDDGGRTLVDHAEALGSEQFRWTSSDQDVAIVDARGSLHLASPGMVEIRSTYGRASITTPITVPDENPILNSIPINIQSTWTGVECQLFPQPQPFGPHSFQGSQFPFGNAIVLNTIGGIGDVADPALVWVRAGGYPLATSFVQPQAGDIILQHEAAGFSGFVLSEVFAVGADPNGCPFISYTYHEYKPHVADNPWPLWQLPGTPALPHLGAAEQPLWVAIAPPDPSVLGAGEIQLNTTPGGAALEIAIAGASSANTVNIEAVAPWAMTRVSALNPVDEREHIVVILERDGVAYEIDLGLRVQEDEGGRYLQIDALTGWHCGLGRASFCPGWFDANIAGSPP